MGLFLALLLLFPATAIAATSTTTVEEVEVDFAGDQELVGEEIEVTFTEEIDRSELEDLPPLPEYHYSRWLLGLPVLCAVVLAWNVRWRPGPRRHERRKR